MDLMNYGVPQAVLSETIELESFVGMSAPFKQMKNKCLRFFRFKSS